MPTSAVSLITATPPAANQASGHVALVISDSESIAKRIESYLRNAGHPLRTAWVTDLEDVEEALRRGAPDLVLCADGLADAPLRDVVDLCRRLAPDLPVVLLTPQFAPEDTVAAMATGARDHVAYDDLRHLRHLELVTLREIAAHQHLRELRATQKRLQIFESRHHELLSGTNDAVAHIQEGILAHANPAFAHLLGHDDGEALIGTPLMDLVAPDFVPKVKEQIKLLLRGKTDNRTLDCCLLHADGRRVAINARLTVSESEGEQLIEMLIRAEAAQLTPDTAAVAPTGRLPFFENLGAAIAGAAQQKQQRAAVLIAIDHYAALEEQLGLHDAEQAVLQLLDWIKGKLGAGDQVFRFSTHELAALVTQRDAGVIQQWGEALIRETGKQIFNTAGHEAHLALTVVAYPFSGSEQASAIAAELVRAARALSAKGGRQFANLGATAQHSLQERELERKAEMVRKALADNRLKLAYQSIASLEGDTRQHFDVLVRVIDEEGREVHASEFIKAAERSAQMAAIDRWVVLRALKMQAKRDGAQEASSLFVKLSEDTLKDSEAFIAWLQEQLKARPLRPGEMVFELQELVLQNHIRKAKLLAKALGDLGAQFAIEHFGVGSNSAQMIEHLPVRFLKFHQSYAKNFGDKETHKRMSALMDLAKQKQIKTIVSHIEDANVMARLWQMGVNFIQGYHVQEPEVVLLSAEVGTAR
ncbi:EAL domain-containing response regulator [Solimonas soli]|uniref:EAL domain-containing response regulator n=1 Tax=Solimonas soli TaxID=413479 RepID=UPI00048412BD|nr:EAL domain-containing protein [Solimonas soli]